jgi:hypothetical protein
MGREECSEVVRTMHNRALSHRSRAETKTPPFPRARSYEAFNLPFPSDRVSNRNATARFTRSHGRYPYPTRSD